MFLLHCVNVEIFIKRIFKMEFLKIVTILCFLSAAYCYSENNSTETNSVSNEEGIITTNEITTEDSLNSAFDLETTPQLFENITILDEKVTNEEDIILTNEITTEDSFTTTFDTDTSQLFENITSFERKACSVNRCKNGGTCVEDFLNPNIYSCICKVGYAGLHCSVTDNCYVNENGIICEKGACVYEKDGSSRSCKCFFGMFWNKFQKECSEPQPPCFPDPCLNGGKCKVKKSGSYSCECSRGYEGENCNIRNECGEEDVCTNGRCMINKDGNVKFCQCSTNTYFNEETKQCEDIEPPCIPNPCKNNGECNEMQLNYNCSCSVHFMGRNCDIENLCYSLEGDELCGSNGLCSEMDDSMKCICNQGYYLDKETNSCKEIIAPCLPNPCFNDGLCIIIDSENFNCSCSEGYSGKHCIEQDLCVLQGGNAFCGSASCESDHTLGIFYCRCKNRFYFDYNYRMCLEIDFCPLMSCKTNGICIDSQCVCQKNYKRNNNTGICTANFCLKNPCPIKEMVCTEGEEIMDYLCSCKKGFSFNGTHCTEAACIFPTFNECEQTCEISEEGYVCSCTADNFDLKEDNKTCDYNGNSTCLNKTCSLGACMKNNLGEETCLCSPGYEELNGLCVDKCFLGNLPDGFCPDNQCESVEKGFKCKCEGKYALSKDEVTCTNRRICHRGEIGWKTCAAKNAKCKEDWDSESGFKCHCTFPQIESHQGFCQDVCSNEEYQRECFELGAKCDVDTNGEKICKCPPLHRTQKNGNICNEKAEFSYLLNIPLDLNTYRTHPSEMAIERYLELDSNMDYFRISYDVKKAMTRIFPEILQVNIINCKENRKLYLCEVELQFLSILSDDLKRIKVSDICIIDKNSTDKCLIPPALILRSSHLRSDFAIKQSDPCDESIRKELCGTETLCVSSASKNSFNCTCGSGYVVRERTFPFTNSKSFIETCNDVDECLDISICPQHTTCQNTVGSYTCFCISGFRIKDRTSDPKVDGCIEICDPNPCDHGSCEEKGDHEFECRCEPGFAGALCNFRDSNFKQAQTNTIIVGAVLGGALLVTIIIFITTVLRLKKKKHQDPDHIIYANEMAERRGGAVNNAFQRE